MNPAVSTQKFEPKIAEGLKNPPRYQEFGKYIINRKELEDTGKLHFRYKKSKGTIPYFRHKMEISEEFKTMMLNLLDNNKINYELIKPLSETEKELFERILNRADLIRVLKYERPMSFLSTSYLNERFKVLQGELIAGNDSPEIKKELKKIMLQLLERKKMTKSDFDDFCELIE